MLNALTTQIDGKGIHEYRSQTGLIICDEDHSSRSAKAIMDYEATSLDHLLTSNKYINALCYISTNSPQHSYQLISRLSLPERIEIIPLIRKLSGFGLQQIYV